MGRLPISLLGGLAAGEASAWASRLKHKAVGLVLAGLAALTAWALLVAAGVSALAETYGAPVAALFAAVLMIVLAAGIVAVMRFIEWRRRRAARQNQSQAALLAAAAAIALPSIVRSRPLLLLALVGGGGLLASRLLGDGGDEA